MWLPLSDGARADDRMEVMSAQGFSMRVVQGLVSLQEPMWGLGWRHEVEQPL